MNKCLSLRFAELASFCDISQALYEGRRSIVTLDKLEFRPLINSLFNFTLLATIPGTSDCLLAKDFSISLPE